MNKEMTIREMCKEYVDKDFVKRFCTFGAFSVVACFAFSVTGA